MPYSAEISRTAPSCFLFLIDQSGSMGDGFTVDAGKKKSEGVADAINKLLQNLVIRCAKEDGVRDYFHVGVIGYGTTVGSAYGGSLRGRDMVPISEIANSPARIEERTKKTDDGAGGLLDQTIRFPIWFEPVANGGTPMCRAFSQARNLIQSFVSQHPDCYPPVVINITDGESTDGSPTTAMHDLSAIQSTDGNVLLFNLMLSNNPNASPMAFPDSENALPDEYAKLLFEAASPLTTFMRSVAAEHGFSLTDGSRGFVLNADLVLIIQALDIGTRPSNLR